MQKLRAGEQFLARGRVHGYGSAIHRIVKPYPFFYNKRYKRVPPGVPRVTNPNFLPVGEGFGFVAFLKGLEE